MYQYTSIRENHKWHMGAGHQRGPSYGARTFRRDDERPPIAHLATPQFHPEFI